VPSLSERIEDSLGLELAGIRVVGGQHGYQHVTGTLADGRSIFAKVAAGAGAAGAAAFAAEANGLRWLAEADGGPPVHWTRRPHQRPAGSAPTWPGCTRRGPLLWRAMARVYSVATAR
jgi:hypothetical protein